MEKEFAIVTTTPLNPTPDNGQHASQPRSEQKRVGLLTRLMPLISALIASGLTAFLLVVDAKKWYLSSDCQRTHSIACWYEDERSSVAIIVQIIATVLGGLWTLSFTTAFNLTVRSQLTGKRTNVERLRLYRAISHKAYDLSLPTWALLISVAFWGLTFLPTWLWTGCLTPQYVQGFHPSFYSITVADQAGYVTPDPNVQLWISCQYLENGTVSNCPDISDPGDLVRSLSIISNTKDLFGNPGWTVQGRSYGVGAGIASNAGAFDDTVLTASYPEVGLLTNVYCYYNQSADWGIGQSLTNWSSLGLGNAPGWASLYWAHGRRPNDNWDIVDPTNASHYITWDLASPDASDIVAFSAGSAGSFLNGTPPYQLSIASGKEYRFLNQTQCDLTFVPTLFNVSVNLTNSQIIVESLGNVSSLSNAPGIIEMTLRRLQGLTQVGTTLYTSTVGEALVQNLQQRTPQFDRNATDPSQLGLVQEALESAVDNILLSISRYTSLNSNQTVEATAVNRYIALGAPKFHRGLAVMNFGALLAIIGVMWWTKIFEGSPAFDFSDLVAMVIAAQNGAGKEVMSWDGDPADKKLNKRPLDMRNKIGVRGPPHVSLE